MDDKELDRMVDEALNIPLPEGLSERLERHVDRLAAGEKKRRIRRLAYRITGIAAVLLLCIGIFIGTGSRSGELHPADTFTDPAEAAFAAGEALAFMSAQLNKGFDQVSDAGEEIEKINQIMYKHLLKK